MSDQRLRGCFVTGTDTEVGKTVVAAAIVARLRLGGAAVRAFKPLLTGLDDPPDAVWPPDHELLARAADADPAEVVLTGYGPPVSPHLAAELAGEGPPSPAQLAATIRARVAAGDPVDATVVEGVGGLLVPLGPGGDVRALAGELGLGLVVVARPGLGTINHTLLTLEAARAGGLTVLGVVLNPWPEQPSTIEASNRKTIARLGDVEVATLPRIDSPAPERLAAAAAGLPLERWLAIPAGSAPAQPGSS